MARRRVPRWRIHGVIQVQYFNFRRLEAQRRKERSEAHLYMDIDVSSNIARSVRNLNSKFIRTGCIQVLLVAKEYGPVFVNLLALYNSSAHGKSKSFRVVECSSSRSVFL